MNVLFLMADQLAPHFLPAYGHLVVKTPRLDEIANNGVVFDAHYSNSPLCMPARAGLMTGRMPSAIDCFDSGCDYSFSVPTLAHYLRVGGYQTVQTGKAHFIGPDQLHGLEKRLTTDHIEVNILDSSDIPAAIRELKQIEKEIEEHLKNRGQSDKSTLSVG